MKVSRNMLMEMAMEIYEEHNGIRIRRPAVMLEFRRRTSHLSPRKRRLLKENLRRHMLREGFLDKIGNFFSGAKNAVTSFIDGFKEAPKRFGELRPVVKKDTQRFYNTLTDICPIEWEPLNNYMLAFTMVKSCMSDSMKGLKTRYAGYRKMCSQEIAQLVNGGQVSALFGGFDSLSSSDIDKAVKGLQDGDIEDNMGLLNFLEAVKKNYKAISTAERTLQRAMRKAAKMANKSRKGWEDRQVMAIMKKEEKRGGSLDKLDTLMYDIMSQLKK